MGARKQDGRYMWRKTCFKCPARAFGVALGTEIGATAVKVVEAHSSEAVLDTDLLTIRDWVKEQNQMTEDDPPFWSAVKVARMIATGDCEVFTQ